MKEYATFGCIPYKNTPYGPLFLMVLNEAEEDHWEFPKGKKEEGETDKETALRELKEETGLEGTISDEETIDFDFECVVRGEQLHKTVRYFYCEVSSDSEVDLQTEELGAYQWLGADEIEDKATYSSMKDTARKVREHFSR